MKLTPERQAEIVKFIEAGNYANVAAVCAGIHPETFSNWMKWGRERRKGIYFEFFDAIQKAEARGEARHVLNIANESKKNWQASAWYLERKHFERWGRRERKEITGEGGGPVEARVTLVDAIRNELKGAAQTAGSNSGAEAGAGEGALELGAASDSEAMASGQLAD